MQKLMIITFTIYRIRDILAFRNKDYMKVYFFIKTALFAQTYKTDLTNQLLVLI